jgi:Family of unknown function (DUF6220)
MSETPGTSGQSVDQRSQDSVPEPATKTKDHAVAAGAPGAAATPLTGLRRGAFLAYRWALLAFLLAGAAQIFLAGLGVFGLFDTGGDTFAPHRALGFAMAGIAVLILVLALIARPGARAIVGSAVLVLLTSLVQSLLAGLGKDHAAYGGLHALDGLLILAVAGYLYAQARRRET